MPGGRGCGSRGRAGVNGDGVGSQYLWHYHRSVPRLACHDPRGVRVGRLDAIGVLDDDGYDVRHLDI